MDYQEELKKIQEGGDYWKPKAGQFKVKALSELEEAEPFVKQKEGQPDEVTLQFKIKLLIEGEEKTWTFGKGKTPASTYGQLIALATKHANQLNGVDFSVVITDDGTKKTYTIVN